MANHVYNLPVPLLESLTPRNFVGDLEPKLPSSPPPTSVASTSAANSRSCNICNGATFTDVEDQRQHYRSDWHRYNVKTRLNGGQAVSETEFSKLVDALEDSISGSASEESDSEDPDDAVDTLVSKATRNNRSPSPDQIKAATPQTAIAWFHAPPATQIGVYKALFDTGMHQSDYLGQLRQMQHGERTWAMFMVAGGHFAGAIVRVSDGADRGPNDSEPNSQKKKQKRPKTDTEVLKHKTFHRYTTRRKQGGSQSVNDNAKGPAKSAGALLRRYGEQALRDDIRNLIQDWAEDINACERIWIRASASNRKIFVDYDGCVIQKGDGRLRTFPFPTRRPTQSEVSRCLIELTRVKTSHFTEEALRAQDEAHLASRPKPKPIPSTAPAASPVKFKPVKLSKEEEFVREKWSRLLEMVEKGRLEPLKSFWEREGESLGGIDAPIPEWTGEKHATLLQMAAYAGHDVVVEWLLEVLHANPTVDVPLNRVDQDRDSDEASDSSKTAKGSRRTAYDVARNRAVRDVFRRCAGLHPDWWDWFGAAKVPSALSKEMENDRDDKKKARRKGLKDKVREREAKAKPPEPNPELETLSITSSNTASIVTGPQRLGGAAGTSESIAGLTIEMRAKVERERRARAAEARLAALAK
ncbi:bVLRF1 domain-containing protein [Mycena indigotica]|uniref:BVLRF1 domain-containing protein n=1 Tax=Mycena indigotica TaxID=2126181 RepID=A0A8H6T0D4_9AGAR|nr:bVLRF1 domain-containing protein [Mycena indigotica]KAF7309635.1 bVLRF1 domain-containing protein [Mycena indigotica]